MADDFLGSIAQEDVQFVTEIVRTVNPGDNYKHLAVYTDDSQIVTGATLATVKNQEGTAVGTYAEVTAANYADVATGTLKTWLTDYFTAGGNESVFIFSVGDANDYSKAVLTDLLMQHINLLTLSQFVLQMKML